MSQLAAPLRQNIPALMGLLGVWNISFLDLNVRAVLPYSQVRNTPSRLMFGDVLASASKRLSSLGLRILK